MFASTNRLCAMKNFSVPIIALLTAVSCSRDTVAPIPSDPATSLSEVARIISRLPLEEEHLMEVYDAVGASSGNGYDEEYMMSDLFASPGSGVGDDCPESKASSYTRPIRELFADYLSRNFPTKAGFGGAEEYIEALSASDVQIYWPYSEDWDGKTLPIITYDPGYGAETNIGYVLEYGPDGAEVVDSVLVDEQLAMTRPVWVINRNDDAGFTPLDMFLESCAPAEDSGPMVSIVGGEEEGRMLFVKSLQMLRNYDSWFGGASEFFIKCGAVDGFNATTEEELRLYTPSVTDFMVVVKRRQLGKTIPLDALLLTNLTPQMENVAFLIIEDDGGKTTSWKCSAVVKYNSKSYGFEISIPYKDRDDIVWRGQLSRSFFEGKDEVSGRFGDVVVTFALR